MTPRSQRRRSSVSRTSVLGLLLGTAAAHAAVVAFVDLPSPGAMAARHRAQAAEQVDAPEWAFTCDADAVLAASLRLAACGSPFGGVDPAACGDASLTHLRADLARCATPEDVEIAFVDVDELELAPVPLLAAVPPVDDVEAARLIDDEVAQKLEEARKQVETPTASGQVVEITRPATEIAPDNARYLSEYDSNVEKQTVARGSTEEMVERPAERAATAAQPAREAPTPAEPAPTPGKEGAAGAAGPAAVASRLAMREAPSAGAAKTSARDPAGERRGATLASSIDGLQPRRGGPPEGEQGPAGGAEARPAAGDGGEGGTATPELRPTEELLERVVGGGSVDAIDDAETGDFTALKTRQWKFTSFFNRMKRQVAQNWRPADVYLRRDPSGKVYGSKSRVTVLQVSLTPTGSVAKVYVARQSGVDFLDEEAVRAFREAEPFPNPPSALVDSRSNLITFSFGFHFQVGGERSIWRLHRADE